MEQKEQAAHPLVINFRRRQLLFSCMFLHAEMHRNVCCYCNQLPSIGGVPLYLID